VKTVELQTEQNEKGKTMKSCQWTRSITIAMTTLLALVTSAAALDMAPAKVRYGQFAGVPLPTIIVAQEKGFFTAQNLTVEVTNVQGPPEAIQALAASNIDLGHTSVQATMMGIDRRAPVTLLSGIEASFTDSAKHQWEAVYLIAREGEGITTLKDLKGKKLGVPAIGGSLYEILLKVRLQELGMDPATDVSWHPVPYPQAASALMQKSVDVVIASLDGYALAQTRGPVTVVASHTSLEGSRVGYTGVLAVSNAFLKDKPDVAVRFIRALLEARKWMKTAIATKDPEYRKLIEQGLRLSPEKVDFYINSRAGYYGKDEEFINALDIPRALIEQYVKSLKTVGLFKPDTDGSYARFVNVDALKQAHASLGLAWDDKKH
jgi:ABC-type nitrate/sulfonate/bicarbonate transport system substrate-binding protein